MVLRPARLANGGQQVFEVTFPAGGVLALAKAAHAGPIEHRFNASAKAAGGFGFRRPDRIEHFHDHGLIDRAHRRVAKHGVNVGRQRRRPLRGVLGVLPGCAVRGDVGFGALLEAHGASRLSGLAGACVGASGQGVDPITRGLEHDRRPLAGILERQADELKAAYAPWLSLEVSDQDDGWILMTARRPASGSVA